MRKDAASALAARAKGWKVPQNSHPCNAQPTAAIHSSFAYIHNIEVHRCKLSKVAHCRNVLELL